MAKVELTREEKLKRLEKTLLDSQKKFGKETIKMANDTDFSDVEVWSTTSPKINDLLGRGLPKGRIIELQGKESSAKSSLCQYLAGQVQRDGGIVAYIDMENAVEPTWAKSLGFDIDSAVIAFPDSQEDALDMIYDLVISQAVDLVVLDSIAQMTPKAELDGEMSDNLMGLSARLNNKFLRKIVGALNKNNITLLAVNQQREKLGIVYGNPTTTPGGNGWKYAASIRLEMSKKETLLDKGIPCGILTRLKAIKNKVGVPYRDTELKLLFHKGFQVEEEWVDFAIKHEVIEKGGSWFTLPNKTDKIQGKENVIVYLKENQEAYTSIIETTKLRMSKLKPEENEDIKKEVKVEE